MFSVDSPRFDLDMYFHLQRKMKFVRFTAHSSYTVTYYEDLDIAIRPKYVNILRKFELTKSH